MKNKTAFADGDDVVIVKILLKGRLAINEDSIDTALDLAADNDAVDDPHGTAFAEDLRMMARHPAVVQYDTVLL